MKTPLETRGSRANDGRSARLGKKQPDGTHAHRIAHVPRIRRYLRAARAACAEAALRTQEAGPSGPSPAGAMSGAGAGNPARSVT